MWFRHDELWGTDNVLRQGRRGGGSLVSAVRCVIMGAAVRSRRNARCKRMLIRRWIAEQVP